MVLLELPAHKGLSGQPAQLEWVHKDLPVRRETLAIQGPLEDLVSPEMNA
jgi:hypothetical protein